MARYSSLLSYLLLILFVGVYTSNALVNPLAALGKHNDLKFLLNTGNRTNWHILLPQRKEIIAPTNARSHTMAIIAARTTPLASPPVRSRVSVAQAIMSAAPPSVASRKKPVLAVHAVLRLVSAVLHAVNRARLVSVVCAALPQVSAVHHPAAIPTMATIATTLHKYVVLPVHAWTGSASLPVHTARYLLMVFVANLVKIIAMVFAARVRSLVPKVTANN